MRSNLSKTRKHRGRRNAYGKTRKHRGNRKHRGTRRRRASGHRGGARIPFTGADLYTPPAIPGTGLYSGIFTDNDLTSSTAGFRTFNTGVSSAGMAGKDAFAFASSSIAN